MQRDKEKVACVRAQPTSRKLIKLSKKSITCTVLLVKEEGSNLTNFTIMPEGDEFRIEPVSDMAKSLKAHCRYRKGNFLYPTQAGAEEAVGHMQEEMLVSFEDMASS